MDLVPAVKDFKVELLIKQMLGKAVKVVSKIK